MIKKIYCMINGGDGERMFPFNGLVNSTITCSSIREVDLDALNMLASGENNSLCVCSYKGDKGHHYFSYKTQGFIPFAQFQSTAGFEDAVAILTSVLPLVKLALNKKLHIENLKTAREYIFQDGQGYRFVYIPIVRKKYVSVREYVLRLFSVIHMRDERLLNLVKELKKLRDDQHFVAHLEEFLRSYKLSGEDTEGETSLLIEESETTVLSQHMMLSDPKEGEASVLRQDIMGAEPGEAETTVLERQTPEIESLEGETTILSQSEYIMEDDADYHFSEDMGASVTSRTAFMQDSCFEAETTLLTSEPLFEQSTPIENTISRFTLILIRSSTGEKIPVEITPFTIGKDRANVDYTLYNDSISRRHATIVYEDGNYYIMDNQSTNGTMIEGIRLQAFEKVELGDGYIISLGSESFQARLERR